MPSLAITVFDKVIWCTIGPKSSLFGTTQFSEPDVIVNYDYIITDSLLIGSIYIPNGAHTNHC